MTRYLSLRRQHDDNAGAASILNSSVNFRFVAPIVDILSTNIVFWLKAFPSECSRPRACRVLSRRLGSTIQGPTEACSHGFPMTRHAVTTWTGSADLTVSAVRCAVQQLGGDLPTGVGRAGAALAECRRRPAPSSTARARLSRSGSPRPRT